MPILQQTSTPFRKIHLQTSGETHCIILSCSKKHPLLAWQPRARKLLRSLNGRVGAPDETLRLPPKDMRPTLPGQLFLAWTHRGLLEINENSRVDLCLLRTKHFYFVQIPHRTMSASWPVLAVPQPQVSLNTQSLLSPASINKQLL